MPDYVKSAIQKFDTVGQVASGPFGGIRKGKFDGNLIQIGDVTYGSSKVLDEKLKDVPHGTYVSVTYTGLVKGKGTYPYKAFTFSFGNETAAKVYPIATAKPEAAVPEEQNLQFLLLLSRLKLKKGDHIAGVIKSACEFSNDPYEALVSAVKQMGLGDLVTDDDGVPF